MGLISKMFPKKEMQEGILVTVAYALSSEKQGNEGITHTNQHQVPRHSNPVQVMHLI